MKHRGIRVRSPFDRDAGRNQGKAGTRRKNLSCKNRPGSARKSAGRAGFGRSGPRLSGGFEPRDQLVEAQLLEALAHRLQLGGRVLDQLAALPAEVERLAQAGLARVELLDDLLDPIDRSLVAGGRLCGHLSTSSRTRAGTPPSAMRSSKSCCSRTAAALPSGRPSGPSAIA